MVGAKRRIKRVAYNRAISAGQWTSEFIGVWDAAQDLVAHDVALSHPKPGWLVLMFPDASDEHWGSFLTQVPPEELDRGVPVEDMTHEPLGFVNVTLKGPEQRWDTMDTKGFPMVSAFKRLEYHLWNGEHIYTNHRNLVYIFDPESCVSSVAKTTAQRLDQWKAVLGQYYYTIMHIARDRNCWGIFPSLSVRASAVYAASEPDETLPSKQAIRDAQQASRANLGTLTAGATSFMTDDGQVTLDEGIFRLRVNGARSFGFREELSVFWCG